MKTTRKIDRKGRLFIPKKLCHRFNFEEHQKVEISVEYGCLCIKKFRPLGFENRPFIGVIKNYTSQNGVILPMEYLNLLDIPLDSYVSLNVSDNKIKISRA